MKWLDDFGIRLMSFGIVAAIVLTGGNAKADFTFGEPVNLGPVVNSEVGEATPCLSADGLELYFSAEDRTGGHGSDDIWVSRRETPGDAWGPPVNLGSPLNTEFGEWYPSISADGLELYYEYWRRLPDSSVTVSIRVTRRATNADVWDPPQELDLAVPDGYMAAEPSLSADGLELYFAAVNRVESKAILYVTKREAKDSPWGDPVSLGPVVNNWSCQIGPRISSDGLVLLFHDWWRCSPHPGGCGLWDIWMTRRATVDSDWEPPVHVDPPINTPAWDIEAIISPDGSTLYLSSDRSGSLGSLDLWQAPILPVVDFDDDGSVGLNDLLTLIESWGTDDRLCDIAPMPWGDGIVDAQDLLVLAEYMVEQISDVNDVNVL